MISHFFIDRPIFASALSIIIVIVGLVALWSLPITQFPNIVPPVVQIEADYPGANAEVTADAPSNCSSRGSIISCTTTPSVPMTVI